jgi:hypothetical protein
MPLDSWTAILETVAVVAAAIAILAGDRSRRRPHHRQHARRRQRRCGESGDHDYDWQEAMTRVRWFFRVPGGSCLDA